MALRTTAFLLLMAAAFVAVASAAAAGRGADVVQEASRVNSEAAQGYGRAKKGGSGYYYDKKEYKKDDKKKESLLVSDNPQICAQPVIDEATCKVSQPFACTLPYYAQDTDRGGVRCCDPYGGELRGGPIACTVLGGPTSSNCPNCPCTSTCAPTDNADDAGSPGNWLYKVGRETCPRASSTPPQSRAPGFCCLFDQDVSALAAKCGGDSGGYYSTDDRLDNLACLCCTGKIVYAGGMYECGADFAEGSAAVATCPAEVVPGHELPQLVPSRSDWY